MEVEEFAGRRIGGSGSLAAALVSSLVLLFLHPLLGMLGFVGALVLGLGRQLRRHHLALDEGGLMIHDTLGLVHRYVPYGGIDCLEFEGRELVARDARGRVLCRSYCIVTERAASTFDAIEAAVASADGSPTGFERGDAPLEEWLAGIDADWSPAPRGAYRKQTRDWALALESFRSPARAPEVRAAAAWALLGSQDPDHRAAVLGAISASVPPLVLAVCALRSSDRAAATLTRDRLRYLCRSDRRAWKRLFRARLTRTATPETRRAPLPA